MQTPEVIGHIFGKMDEVVKCPRKFLIEFSSLIFSIQGRLTFMNMSHYSRLNESTIRRHYSKFFDWIKFNLLLMQLSVLVLSETVIGVLDCSYVP